METPSPSPSCLWFPPYNSFPKSSFSSVPPAAGGFSFPVDLSVWSFERRYFFLDFFFSVAALCFLDPFPPISSSFPSPPSWGVGQTRRRQRPPLFYASWSEFFPFSPFFQFRGLSLVSLFPLGIESSLFWERSFLTRKEIPPFLFFLRRVMILFTLSRREGGPTAGVPLPSFFSWFFFSPFFFPGKFGDVCGPSFSL